MRAIRAASTALLGAAALVLAAAPGAVAGGAPSPQPPAPGGGTADFVITPGTVAPGGRITLSAPGCRSTATAASGIFDTVTIAPGSSSTATVDADARPGAVYTVSFNCTGGGQGNVALTIAGVSAAVPTARSTVLTPPRGVRGGLGGSIEATGPGMTAVGGAMVLVAAGGLAYAIRRRTADGRRR
ncbi:hypothetical protein ABZ990_00520 [Streptomyces sp. NPDC046203]|uniref:hypothetical protein n=1 Tax=Streptomyces sp. NPDC046203 TaxID=3154602 RepID=UPI0033F95D86